MRENVVESPNFTLAVSRVFSTNAHDESEGLVAVVFNGCIYNHRELREQLDGLMRVHLSEGRTLRLDAFRRSTGKTRFTEEEQYLNHMSKRVRNTVNNTALLLLNWPEDPVLLM